MSSVIHDKKARTWRIRWREGGRGSKQKTSERFTTKGDALEFQRQVDARAGASKDFNASSGRLITWLEVVQRWRDTRAEGRYRDMAKKYLDTLPWKTTSDATPDTVSKLRPLYQRYVKSCLRFARVMLDQRVDQRALEVKPPKRTQRPRRDLLADEDIAALVDRCALTGPGNGAIAHLLSTYGHRAENIVHLTASAWEHRAPADTLTLRVKGGDLIRHPILPQTSEILRPLVEAALTDPKRERFLDHKGTLSPALFINQTGKPWLNGQRFAAFFIGQISKGIGYYDAFKRAAITKMLDHVDAKTVASITGHRTVSLLLNTYSRTTETRQRNALEAIKKSLAISTVLPPCSQEKS
jgi:hypothetical protein